MVEFGVSGSALEWFKSYMHDRQQYVIELALKCPECVNLHTEFH